MSTVDISTIGIEMKTDDLVRGKKELLNAADAGDKLADSVSNVAKTAERELAKLNKNFDKTTASLQKEIALHGETGKAAKVRYDLELGALSKLDSSQKEVVSGLNDQLDAMKQVSAAYANNNKEIERNAAIHDKLLNSILREVAAVGEAGRVGKTAYDTQYGSLSKLNDEQRESLNNATQLLQARKAEQAAIEAQVKATQALQNQYSQIEADLKRQTALYGEVGRAAALRYDLEQGELKQLSTEQKQSLINQAAYLDMLEQGGMVFDQNTAAVNRAAAGYKNFNGIAGQLGYQLQDSLVQAQMGTSAFIILSQQGSQLASVIHPLAGLFVALAGVAGGALYNAFKDTSESAEDFAENTKELAKELYNLSDAQQLIINKGLSYSIEDETKKRDELTKSIAKQREEIERLNAEQGKTRSGSGQSQAQFGAYAGGGQFSEIIDNTHALAEANRNLAASETSLIKQEQALAELRDPTGNAQRIADLEKEVELAGKQGKALYLLEAAQKGMVGWQAQQYVQLKLTADQREADAKAAKDAIEKQKKEQKKADDERERAAEKAIEKEKQRAENISKQIAEMKKAADLAGDSSRYAEIEYEILNNILKVKGGINGEEAKALLMQAKRLDMIEEEKRLNDVFNDEIQRDIDKQLEAEKKANKERMKFSKDAAERINAQFSDAWLGVLNDSKNVFDGIEDSFKQMLAEMLHEAYTKPIVLNIQQKLTASSSGETGQAAGAASSGGIWGLVAAAVLVGVNEWNKEQKGLFQELTSEFRQERQSTGTLLGMANTKSDSLNKSIEELKKHSDNLLGINDAMLSELIQIKNGLGNVAAGFAKTLTANNVGINTGTTSFGFLNTAKSIEGTANRLSATSGTMIGGDSAIADFVAGFTTTITDKVAKAIYNKKTKLVDSGIVIEIGQSLTDVLAQGTLEAFAYADIQTKKKVLGITTSTKVKTQTEELNDILLSQLADVYSGGAEVLKQAADAFGIESEEYFKKLVIDPQKLSLKGLEGDALTQEIENFLSSQLDKWAQTLVGGTDALEQFQLVGEGAFETVVRLAGQLNSFKTYADLVNLSFDKTGFQAVEIVQSLADLSGGFENLQGSLSGYYKNFFTEQERSAKELELLKDQFKSLGVDVFPQTREAFRALIEQASASLDTERSREYFASLLQLQGAYANLIPATEELAENANNAAAILNERQGLEVQLLRLQGETAEVRRRELEQLDPTNRAIQEQIWALQDLQAANEEGAASAKRIASERYSLETEILQLQGKTAELRARELSLLDPSNKSLQEQIWLIEDKKKADEEAAKIADELSKAESKRAEERAKARQKAAEEAEKAAQKAADEAAKAAEQQKKLMQDVHDNISDALRSLRGESKELNDIEKQRAKNILTSALSTAKAGGSLVGFEGLEEALKTVQDIEKSDFSSELDYRRTFAQTISLLTQLEKFTKVDGSHASGLNSVPFDGYMAVLHRGEQVKTKSSVAEEKTLIVAIERLRQDLRVSNGKLVINSDKVLDLLNKWDGDGLPETRVV